MPDRDDWVRDRLERLEPPPAGARFEEELWERVAAREAALTRRWRRASIGLALVAAAAVAAAATIDRTLSCRLQATDGIPAFAVEAWPVGPTLQRPSVRLTTGRGSRLLDVEHGTNGFTLDSSSCRGSGTSVSLGRDGLDSAGAHGPGDGGLRLRCFLSSRVLVRLRLSLDEEGRPHRAVVAIRSTAGRLLALVQWTPGLVLGYAAGTCPTP
jgi:hypothetical protein